MDQSLESFGIAMFLAWVPLLPLLSRDSDFTFSEQLWVTSGRSSSLPIGTVFRDFTPVSPSTTRLLSKGPGYPVGVLHSGTTLSDPGAFMPASLSATSHLPGSISVEIALSMRLSSPGVHSDLGLLPSFSWSVLPTVYRLSRKICFLHKFLSGSPFTLSRPWGVVLVGLVAIILPYSF